MKARMQKMMMKEEIMKMKYMIKAKKDDVAKMK